MGNRPSALSLNRSKLSAKAYIQQNAVLLSSVGIVGLSSAMSSSWHNSLHPSLKEREKTSFEIGVRLPLWRDTSKKKRILDVNFSFRVYLRSHSDSWVWHSACSGWCFFFVVERSDSSHCCLSYERKCVALPLSAWQVRPSASDFGVG